jgi:hypothetical protein
MNRSSIRNFRDASQRRSGDNLDLPESGIRTFEKRLTRTYTDPLNALGHAWGSLPGGADLFLKRHGGVLSELKLHTRPVTSQYRDDGQGRVGKAPVLPLILPTALYACTLCSLSVNITCPSYLHHSERGRDLAG